MSLFGLAALEHVSVWRQYFGYYDTGPDCDGRTIRLADYGKQTEHGWEIDHAMPTILGGHDGLANKRPRHWQGNRSAGAIIGNALRPRGLF